VYSQFMMHGQRNIK